MHRMTALVVFTLLAYEDRRRRTGGLVDAELGQDARELGAPPRNLVVRLVGRLADVGERQPEGELVRLD